MRPTEPDEQQPATLGYETARPRPSLARRHPLVWNTVAALVLLVAVISSALLVLGVLGVSGVIGGDMQMAGRTMRTFPERLVWLATVGITAASSTAAFAFMKGR